MLRAPFDRGERIVKSASATATARLTRAQSAFQFHSAKTIDSAWFEKRRKQELCAAARKRMASQDPYDDGEREREEEDRGEKIVVREIDLDMIPDGDPIKIVNDGDGNDELLEPGEVELDRRRKSNKRSGRFTMGSSSVKDLLVRRANVDAILDAANARDVKNVVLSWQQLADEVVTHPAFEWGTALVVVVCTILIIVEVETDGETQEDAYHPLNLIIAVIYTIEFILRSLAKTKATMMETLYVLDVILVIAMWLHLIIFVEEATTNLPPIFVLRMFRFLRVCLSIKWLPFADILEVLVMAWGQSIQPILLVILLLGVFIFAMALLLVSLVPIVAEDSLVIKASLLSHYPSVGEASLSLLEAMFGIGHWLPSVALPVLDADSTGWASLVFLTVLFLCIALLHLGLIGLVSGVFLDHIFGASERLRVEEEEEIKLAREQYASDLHLVFEKMFPRYQPDEMIQWKDVQTFLKAWGKGNDALLLLDMSQAQLQKVYITVVGSLQNDISIQAFQKALYRNYHSNVDMMLVSDQQEKGSRGVKALEDRMLAAINAVHSKLRRVLDSLQESTKTFQHVQRKLDEFRELETKAASMLKEMDEVTWNTLLDTAKLERGQSPEVRRGDVQLNELLHKVEASFSRCEDLRNRKPSKGDISPRLKHEAVEVVSKEIVACFRDALLEEMDLARGGPESPMR